MAEELRKTNNPQMNAGNRQNPSKRKDIEDEYLINNITKDNKSKTEQRLVLLDEIDLLIEKLSTVTLVGDNKSYDELKKEIKCLITTYNV